MTPSAQISAPAQLFHLLAAGELKPADNLDRQMPADVSGMPGYPVVVLAHPLANNDDATLRVKAQEAVQQCLQQLQAR